MILAYILLSILASLCKSYQYVNISIPHIEHLMFRYRNFTCHLTHDAQTVNCNKLEGLKHPEDFAKELEEHEHQHLKIEEFLALDSVKANPPP